ncbi:MAG: polysaccharide deacetylase family protein [Bacillota bacterium]
MVAFLVMAVVFRPDLTCPASTRPGSDYRKAPNTSSDNIRMERPLLPYRDMVIVLMFHNISSTYQGRGTISPELFAADIDALLAGGYHIIPVSRLVDFLQGKTEVPLNAVAITFDDGSAGVYRYGFPILHKNRLPAAVFLTTDYVGKKPGFLTWPQVRKMAGSGLITFGGHTHASHFVAPTSPKTTAPATVGRIFDPTTGHKEVEAEYRMRLFTDNLHAQQIFRRELGGDTPYFAYPYGAYSPELERILRAVGYEYCFTTLTGANRAGHDFRHIYRINAGTPWTSPERLIENIQRAAWLCKSPRGVPAGWMPQWAQDPAFKNQMLDRTFSSENAFFFRGTRR